MHRVAAFLALFFVSFSGVLHAQTTDASLTGRVTDPQKAIIVDAKVTAINVGTNVPYEATSNKSGDYYVTGLPPGSYRIEVEKAGFKTVIKPGVVLHVQDTIEVNFEMTLGSVSETVTVSAGASPIDTTDATVSTTIDRNFAENLPLNGRSFQTLILLTPGTVIAPVGANGGTISVNGQRTNANSFSVDGVSANLGGFIFGPTAGQLNGSTPGFTVAGTTQGMVSVDALQEFKIQTSTYSPEFGRQPGGQVSLLTRSGTNAFHGTAFDYVRNDVFDANNWFNDAATPPLPKGKERQNDFGGTLGGPIFKDKTFFFFSYEGLRLLQPDSEVDQVPSLRLRQEAAPAFQAILDSWPIPTLPEGTVPDPTTGLPVPTGASPYHFSQSFPTNLDSFSLRIDHTLAKGIHIFGRYASTSSVFSVPNSAPNNTLNDKVTTRTLTLGTDMSISPNLQNELRANYAVSTSPGSITLNLVGGAKAFDTSVLYPAPLVNGQDSVSFCVCLPNSGFITSPGAEGKFSQRQINLIDNVSYSKGAHQLKWGVDYQRLFPIGGDPRLTAPLGVYSESDLISGRLSFARVEANLVAHPIFTNFSLFAQDTWRVSSGLTVTYGLRWDLNPAPGERDGFQPYNLIGLDDPATATLAPINSPLYKTTYNNFAPRIGAAYQLIRTPGHETVLRAGFGVFYDLSSEFVAEAFRQAPFETLSQPFTNLSFPVGDNILPAPPVPTPPTPPFGYLLATDPNLKLPYTLQWNVSLETGLGRDQSFTTSYVASAGRRLLRSDTLFDFNPSFTTVFDLRNASSSNYQSLQLQFNRHLSHGLQALASYTYSHSIDNASDGQAFYSASLTGNTFLNPNIDKGDSAFDLRHAFRAAVTYNIPTWNEGLVSKVILGGWSLDTIAFAQTGPPVDLVGGNYSESALPNGFFSLRPNLVLGEPLYLYGAQCTASNGGTRCPGGMRFNPAAFTPVPTDTNGNPTQVQGTLGRNVLRGFGAWQMDFAIHRQFNFTERVNLQFRGEFFNVFNHPNFGNVDSFLGDGTFGQATSTLNNALYGGSFGGLNSLYQIGGPRSIQLALKLQF
jgi:hypothetical protein